MMKNELDLVRRHYAWLTLAEGKKYKAYQEQLTDEISQDENYQSYLDILRELEEEGKERMAYEVVSRIINEMPFERLEAMLVNMSENRIQKLLVGLPTRHLQKALAGLRIEQLQSVLSTLPAEQLQSALTALPAERLQNALTSLPSDKLRTIRDMLNQIDLDG